MSDDLDLVYSSDRGVKNEVILLSWLPSPHTPKHYLDWRLGEGGGGIYIESKITSGVTESLARQTETAERDM